MTMTALQPPAIAPELIDRAIALNATGEYLKVLIEVAQELMRDTRDHLRQLRMAPGDSHNWRQIEVLLNLAHDQAHVVLDVGRDFDLASVGATA